MRLPDFIISNLEPILVDWVSFARRQVMAVGGLDEVALLDHGTLILQQIAVDMHAPQREDERQAKSEGSTLHASNSNDVPSRRHARERERQGFDVEQMVSEYRALRATVLRHWSASSRNAQVADLEDVMRFNEAIDQAVAESLATFMAEMAKTRGLFLGMLSHDLRGPLGTIKSCVAMLLRDQPAEIRPAAMILRSVAQMRALLDDLVEYTRNRLSVDLIINPTTLQLDEFAQDTLDEIRSINGSCELELKVQGMMRGQWDSRRLHQALSNLVFNALKYGYPNRPIHVGLDGSQPQEMLLTVQNEGKPIPADLLAKIFEPLVRVEGEKVDKHLAMGANLGLGLFVVRQVAIAHGGTVSVTSDDSITCFQLRLPRAVARPESSDWHAGPFASHASIHHNGDTPRSR